jgi:proline-specific peptidase
VAEGTSRTHAIPAPESTGTVDVAGGRIWYRSNGDRHTDKPPLVCVHGGPGVPHNYLLPLTALSGERRVILYDQLDVGKSDKPGDPKNWTVARFVAEIDALRKALNLEEVHLFGNSWGGTIAAEYAISRPQGLKSLTLSGPLLSTARWIADNDDYIRALSPEAQDALALSGGRGADHDPKVAMAVAEYNRRHLCRADPWPDFLEAALNGTNTTVYNTMWGPTEFICTGTLQRYDCTGRLSHIEAPTLIICGQYDESAPPSCHAFSKMIPGAQLAVIPNASHLPFIERSDSFLVVLRTFLVESE